MPGPRRTAIIIAALYIEITPAVAGDAGFLATD
jgi:hypothetical protein